MILNKSPTARFQNGVNAKPRFICATWSAFAWLADNPGAGRVRNEIGEGYRSFRQGSHLVFYVLDNGFIAIIGVPQGAMDIYAFF